ncbi:MAG: prephenate dehydrogenase [Chloroflexi bacterium]|jgi:prephenate dehydrogenase|nr:prephenate dehydrogenase [Chloroflexota bacterium]
MDVGFPSLEESHIAIVGLGLMGGSFALALRQAGLGRKLIGIDLDEGARTQAAPYFDVVAADLEPIRQAHLVVLAAPVRAILRLLQGIERYAAPGAILLDFGSTKRAILEAMRRLPEHLQPIGGHPLCGREQSGFAAATPDLFRGARFVLIPLARTSPQALDFVEALLRRLEMTPLIMSAEEHDQLLAVTSHLPYLLAACLMQVALENEKMQERLFQVAASGFRDTSRLAASHPRMMLDILMTNREPVLEALRSFQQALSLLQTRLEEGQEAALEGWMEAIRQQRRRLNL